jgi:hypothetical protein
VGFVNHGYYSYVFTKNIIENNDTGILLNGPAHVFYCNKICNNTTWDLYNNTSMNPNISDNYWCTTDTAIISAHIYDGHDNGSLGLVDFLPVDTTQCYQSGGNCLSFFYVYPDTLYPHHYYAVNLASGTLPLSWLWEWGDGTSDTIAYPSHTYSVAGLYYICLTITDFVGCTQTYCDSSLVQKDANTLIYINVIPPGTVGLNDTRSWSFSVFPNPVKDLLTIETEGSAYKCRINIYDLQGREVLNREMSGQKISIDISGLSRGMYFLKFSEKKSTQIKKIIKE